MTFEEIEAEFARGPVSDRRYRVLTTELSRLRFVLYIPPDIEHHQWSRGAQQLWLRYSGADRAWTRCEAGERR